MKRDGRDNIRLLALDVDGTLTDGRLYIGNEGELCKTFDVKDGCGICDILPRYGIRTAVITARKSLIVEERCRELSITDVLQGCRDKAAGIRALAGKYGYKPDNSGVYREIAYMGDDLLDIACMAMCAVSACPADAAGAVRLQAARVCENAGGQGAVREFIEWLVENRSVEA